jgi:anaerobic magnesium-protoporphyrin IX monomethyl ester cyclase
MKKKILFTHSYFLRFDAKQWKQQQPYPPLATIYAAAVMRAEGYEVALFDTMFAESPEEINSFLENFKPGYVVIYDDGFNYLTKMCLTNMREAAFRMEELSKKAGCKVIVCSSDATDHAEKYLGGGADFIIKGEGEITLKELIGAMESGETDVENIPGLSFLKDEKIITTKGREVLRNLDSLPLPAWDLIQMNEYRDRWKKHHGYFSLNISTTRGCPFHCNWCAKPIYGNRYNVHDPQHVVGELKMLMEQFGAEHFWMTDDIFGLKPGWINAFASLVEKEKISLRFKIQSRVDLLLQEENIAALAKAGCETVWVGAESGSQKILDAMDKGTKVEQIYEATELLKKHNIRVAFFLQFGYPGETKEDIDSTVNMVMDLMPDDIGVSVSYPLPGTKFYERVKSGLKEKANWKDSDELAMLFHNTFPSPFYKELQRYLHKRYRTKQGINELKNLFTTPVTISSQKLRKIAGIPFYFSGSLLRKNRLEKFKKQAESLLNG